jgi:membrane protein YdbS with pleckstrin-like domain
MITYAQTQKMPSAVLGYAIGRMVLKIFLVTLPFALAGSRAYTSALMLLFIFIGIPGVIYALLGFKNTSFMIEEGKLTINRGIINKQSKTIPFNTVQNASVFGGPVTSLFGIAGIKIWTASPGQHTITQDGKQRTKPDGYLFLFTEDANWLKDEIFKGR